MRLIVCKDLVFEEFAFDFPVYAILSHTWGSEEITYEEFCKSHDGTPEFKRTLRDREGWKKIKRCCQQALAEGFKYCWIDTCCIDKKSSAELSEAINSMYRWYKGASICYVYLSDVSAAPHSKELDGELKGSRWFTRGWTLQELIAPYYVKFFGRDWIQIGTKVTLCGELTKITGIDMNTLLNPENVHSESIARRMSWASHRSTTRTEDIAYCLLGLFDVNMPLLYGEGDKAFLRLQEEIIRVSDDQSIFAWDWDTTRRRYCPTTSEIYTHGFLATHPSAYRDSGQVEILPIQGDAMAMTNRGLWVNLPIVHLNRDEIAIVISCCKKIHEELWTSIPTQIAIPIRTTLLGDGSFGRDPTKPTQLVREAEISFSRLRGIYLKKTDTFVSVTNVNRLMHAMFLDMAEFHYSPVAAIQAPKPLTWLTDYVSWKPAIRYESTGGWKYQATKIELPRGDMDVTFAIRFVHAMRHTPSFIVIVESRRKRKMWSNVILVDEDERDSLESILESNTSAFRMYSKQILISDQLSVRSTLFAGPPPKQLPLAHMMDKAEEETDGEPGEETNVRLQVVFERTAGHVTRQKSSSKDVPEMEGSMLGALSMYEIQHL